VDYCFINEHRHKYSLSGICRVLRVARPGFYTWLHKTQSNRATNNS